MCNGYLRQLLTKINFVITNNNRGTHLIIVIVGNSENILMTTDRKLVLPVATKN